MGNLVLHLKKHKGILVILSISLFIRILFSIDNNKALFVDISSYDSYASILMQKGYFAISAYHPPLYPSFLAFIYSIFTHSFIAVYMVQAVMGTAGTLLIYLIARHVFDYKTGIISAGCSLLYWPLTLYSGILLSETVFIFLLLLGVYNFLKGIETNKPGYFIACGVFMALSTLTRSINLLLLIILPAVYAAAEFKKYRARVLKNSFLYMLTFLIIMTPWMVRNFLLYQKIIPVDTLGGVNLYIGNNPRANGFFMDISTDPLNNIGKNDYENDQILKRAAIHYIFSHPVRSAALTVWRGTLFVFFDLFEFDWVLSKYMSANRIFSLPLLEIFFRISNILYVAMAAYSLPRLLRNRKGIILAGFILYYFCLTSLFYVQARYRLPVMPFLSIPCAFTVEKIKARN